MLELFVLLLTHGIHLFVSVFAHHGEYLAGLVRRFVLISFKHAFNLLLPESFHACLALASTIGLTNLLKMVTGAHDKERVVGICVFARQGNTFKDVAVQQLPVESTCLLLPN